GAVGGVRVDAEPGSLAGRALALGRPVVVEDAQADAELRPPPELGGLRVGSGAAVVIGGQERPYGVLEVGAAERRGFTTDDVHFLQAVANVLAAAMHRWRVEEELAAVKDALAAQLADMTRLHELSSRLSASLELKPLLDEVLAAATALQRTDMGVLLLREPEGEEFVVAASSGLGPEYLEAARRLPLGLGLCGTAIAERRGVVVEDVETDPRFAPYLGAARLAGYRAAYSTPLITPRGDVLGTIALYFRQPHRPTEHEMRLLELYARHAAGAIENARLYRQAQEAVQARDAFLARASHELRTPLTSALGTVRLLDKVLAGRLAQPPQELLAIANRNLDAILALINDLLDASKLESGRVTLALAPVRLAELVGRSLDVVGGQAREKGVTLRTEVPEDLALSADPLKLEQVLVNLLANAVKFTPAGGQVTVEARAAPDGVLLRVRDTGEGIAAEHLERIFEPFFQAGGPAGRRARGTGLGLAICRQIVELHGGRIWAESEGPGRGSTFTVRLPARPSERQRAA
ncbi:MAG TPA: GAF domain-containing protein, partial [Thermodesulfobacteriota bacterium]|nr:GAF domain-containing protein [Thermodesulfobacteriota bacterium]